MLWRTLVRIRMAGKCARAGHSLDRACTSNSSGPVLHLGDLPTQLQKFHLQNRRQAVPGPARTRVAPGSSRGTGAAARPVGEAGILETLRKLNGDKLLAARLPGHRKDHAVPQAQGIRHRRPDGEDHARNDDSAAPAYESAIEQQKRVQWTAASTPPPPAYESSIERQKRVPGDCGFNSAAPGLSRAL